MTITVTPRDELVRVKFQDAVDGGDDDSDDANEE